MNLSLYGWNAGMYDRVTGKRRDDTVSLWLAGRDSADAQRFGGRDLHLRQKWEGAMRLPLHG